MIRFGAIGLVGLLAAFSTGCVSLDKYQALERANRVLQEDLSRANADLTDSRAMLQQKDTIIGGLENQLATEKSRGNSLSAENASLRDALKRAQDILEANAARGVGGPITIVRNALPEPLSNELTRLAEAYPGILEFDPRTGSVRWKSDLLFPLGSDSLSNASEVQEALRKFAEIVASDKAAGFDVVVVGHTCTTRIGRPETLREHKTNWHLSAHRAIAVMNMLTELQVASDRVGVMGYGEFRPIAENTTEQGMSRNRRVDIYLVPQGSVSAFGGGVYGSAAEGFAFVKPHEVPADAAR
jgi:chemotaxis protein MotB